MTLHAARLDQSPRLQRVHALLARGGEFSTLDIVRRARVCAVMYRTYCMPILQEQKSVNSIVAELRANGDDITCRQTRSPSGEQLWLYQMRQIAGQTM